MLITQVVLRYSSYIHPRYIYFGIQSTRQLYPQLSTFIYICMQHVNTPVTTTISPLDRRLDGHALATHTYLSVEAIDPYLTIQRMAPMQYHAAWTTK